MSFKIVLLPPDVEPDWPEKIERAVPGSIAKVFSNPEDALAEIEDADAAYGTVPPAVFGTPGSFVGSPLPALVSEEAGFLKHLSRVTSSLQTCAASITSN